MIRAKNEDNREHVSKKKGIISRKMLMYTLFGALAFVGVLVILAILSQPASAGPILSVEIEPGGQTEKTVQPGGSVSWSISNNDAVLSRNQGDADALDVNLTVMNLPQYWSSSINPATFDLFQGSSQKSGLTIGAPSNATHTDTGYQITIRLDWGSQVKTTEVIVKVAQVYGVGLNSDAASKKVDPGFTVIFNLNVSNTGNGEDTINMTISGERPGWIVSFTSSSFMVPPFSYAPIQLSCFVPTGELKGTYPLSITATSEIPSYFHNININIGVNQTYGVTLEADPSNKNILPDEIINYEITANNGGNANDTFQITTTSVPSGWSITAPPSVTITEAGASKNFTVTLGASSDALKNELVVFYVNATTGGPSPITYSQQLTAKVSQVFGIDIRGVALTQSMAPGEWGVFTVNVSNTGNGDDIINIFVDGLPPDWPAPNYDSSVDLSPDEYRVLEINVTAGTEALHQNYDFYINISSAGDISKTKYRRGTASITQTYEVSVVVLQSTKFAEPEETVTFTIQVTNEGNGEDDIRLEEVDVPIGWVTSFSQNPVNNIDHGQLIEITYYVTPAENASVGPNLIKIFGNSTGDQTVPPASGDDTVNVQIKQVYDVVVNTAKPSNTVVPNSVITYNLTVRNDGTGDDTFELNISVDPDKLDVLTWVSLEDPAGNPLTSLTLARDEKGYVILKVNVPTVSGGGVKGSYNITLIAESLGNTSVSSSKTTITQIIGVYDVFITSSVKKGEAAPGNNVTYTFFVQNIGTETDFFDIEAFGTHDDWAEFDIAPPWVQLAPDEMATITVTFKIPELWEEFGPFFTQINATSRTNTTIMDYLTYNTTITQVRDVMVESSIKFKDAEPNQYAYFEIKVRNEGTAEDTFTIAVPDTEPYKGWVSFPDGTSFTIPAGAFEMVNVSILVDEDATVGDYIINITATSEEEETATDTIDLTVDVQQIYGVKIWAYDPDIDGDPDTDVIFSITVSNEGNGEDTFDISADSGWVKEYETLVELGPGETSTFNVTVHIPNGEPVGDVKINILAISRGNTTANETEPLNVGVNPIYDLDIYSSPSSGKITPGTSKDFTIVVENLGTGNDTIKFKIEGTNKDWAKMYKGTTEVYQIFVEAGKTETMILTITVPSDEAKASSIVFTINATSVESKTVIVSDTDNIIIDVDQSYDGYISCSDPSQNEEPGIQVEFQLEIYNEGNSDDTFLMAVLNKRSGWTYSFTNPSVGPIPSGGYQITKLLVTPDAEEVQGWYNIRIRATSSEPTVFFEYDQINLTVDQKYRVELESSGPSTRDVELEGGSTAFYVKVFNRGNGPDTLSLSVFDTDQDYWVEMSHSDVSPDPNDFTLITVWINISSRSEWVAKGEPHPILIKIEVITPGDPTPSEAEGTRDVIQLTANIKDIYGLFVEIPSLIGDVEIGSSVTFDFKIRNEGTTDQQYKVTTMNYDSTNLSAPTYNPSQSPFPSTPSPADIDLDMIVQPKADGLRGEYKIWIRIVVDQDTKVQYHLNVTVKIKALYGVDLRAQNDEINKETLVNTYANYTLVIKNIGNDNDRFFLSSTGTYSGLVTFEHSYVILGPDESAFVKCYVFADQTIIEANNLYPTGIPNIIKVASENETEKSKEISLDTDITEIHSLSLSSPDFEKDVEPGETGNFILYVENTGTTNDKYVHSVVAYDTSALANPTFNPVGPTFPTSPVSAGTSTTLNVNVNVLTKDPMVSVGLYNLTIRISIDGYKTIYKDYTFTVEVKQVYLNKLEVEVVDDDRKDADVDEYVNYTLRIKNSGNGPETFDIVATGKYSALVTPEMDEITLDQEESITLRIMVFTDENYIDRDDLYGLDLETPIKVTSKSDPDSFDVELTLYTAIKETIAEVEITITDPNDEGEPGDVIEYIVKIINKGNTEDTFTLSITGPNKDWGEIYDRSGINILDEVTLNEYESAKGNYFIEVMIKVTIPGTGETSAGTTYPVTIVAASTNKEGEQDEKNVNTKVKDYVDLKLEYSGSGSTTKDYDPNKKTPKFSFRLTNNGNKPEAGIEVRVDPEDWNYSPGTIAEEVEAGGTATFSLEFTIPDEETEGEYDLQVYLVSSVDSSEESDPVLITINITKPDLTIKDVIMPTEDTLKRRVDEQVSISATVSNEGHAKAESLTVKLYVDGISKGTETISSIEPGGSREVNFRWEVEADLLDIEVKVTEIEEIDTGNNAYPPIYLDLRPNLQFEGEQLNFSNSKPDPGEKITIRALILNTGGDAKGVVVKFTYGTKTIGTDTLDIDYNEVGEATFEDWTVPDKPGDSISIKATIDLEDAIGDREEASKSIKLSEVGGVAGVFTGSGLIGMGIGLIIGALLFLIIGLAIGRRGAAARRGPEGMAGPSFAAFEKEMPEGAEKKAPKGPAPFERREEEAPPEEEEKAKPREIARVRCPKCGKVTEVTSTQRPLQIPCECGTTLMLKK